MGLLAFFSLKERYLREFYRSGPLFPIPQGTLLGQPILGKICENDLHSTRWRFEPDSNIAIPIYRLKDKFFLHSVHFWCGLVH